jgi:phosphatidylserine synthase 2
MYLGVKTCEYFEMKQYSWQGLAEIPTLRGKMKRTMAQFTPKSWTKFEWDMTKSFKSYCTVLFILTMVSQFILCPTGEIGSLFSGINVFSLVRFV